MGRVHVRAHGAVPPERFVAALTDFGPGRGGLGQQRPEDLVVHDRGDTWADVTEGSAAGGVWQRLRYDWSVPDVVTLEVLDSNAFGPGSRWTYRVESDGAGGCLVDLTIVRVPTTTRGQRARRRPRARRQRVLRPRPAAIPAAAGEPVADAVLTDLGGHRDRPPPSERAIRGPRPRRGRGQGLGTVGAVMGLLDAGWTFPRVAGTSVGALAAAFAAAGADSTVFREVLGRLDLRRIPDRRVPLPL